MDSSQRVKDLIIICQRLSELLEKENALLRGRRPAAIEAFLEDKGALCRAYETRVGGLLSNREELADVEPGARDRLRALGGKVDALIVENERLLKVAIEAHRRVMQVIADAVSSSQPGPSVYSPAGRVRNGASKAARGSTALTYNQAL